MRVFCQECGAANEGEPGTKVMCTRCTSIFEVPGHFTPAPDAPVTEAKPFHPEAGTSSPPASPAPDAAQLPPTGAAPQWSAPTTTVFSPDAGAVLVPKVHSLAVISLVVGIVGSACCFIGPIAALVTGGIGYSKINAEPNAYTGKGLALAGMILGGVELAFWLLSIVWAMVGHS